MHLTAPLREADAHGLTRRRPVDRADVSKTEARAESNTAHGVQLCVSESLDVAPEVNDAAAKMDRDACLDGVPVLYINSKRARCAVSLKVIQ